MNICLPNGIPDQTDCGTQKILQILKFLGFAQIFIGIFGIFVDVSSGLVMILGSLILFLAVWSKSWCVLFVFIIFSVIDVMTSLMIVGNYYTENDPVGDLMGVLVTIYLIKFPFYMVVVFYSFLAYRELKASFIEAITGARVFENYGTSRERDDRNTRNVGVQEDTFSGKAYRLE